jgi:2-oxo-4-hydroxy-4-carboxy-5-ureidoimidazoline decarboxylase
MSYSIAELNQLSQEDFVRALGAVFEDTPAIAEHAWHDRPFTDAAELHQKMAAIVRGLPEAQQLVLIRAHPDLGSRAKMAEASVQEQAGVGLDRLSAQEYEQFQALNQTYTAKFGFPFIVAVKTHNSRASILATFEQRLHNSFAEERQRAIAEIIQIARFRLEDLVRG